MYTRKSLQTTLSFFWVDLENLSGIYLKITIYKHLRGFFKGILKGLLLDSLVFVVTLYPGWGCTFVVFFFWPVHGKCSDWGWAELLYSYKILTQQSSPNTNPDPFPTLSRHAGTMSLASQLPWRPWEEEGKGSWTWWTPYAPTCTR